MGLAFCIGELWRKVSSLLFKPETGVLCSPYNVVWPLASAFDGETIQFSTRMNIHLGTKWTEKDGLWKRKDIAVSNSIWNHFQSYNISLLSEGCSPYSTNSGLTTMWCRITMETTVLFNRRLNNCFFMLEVAIASVVTAWRILVLYFQTDFSSWTDIYSISAVCYLNKCYSKWSIQNVSMICKFRNTDLIIKAIRFQGKEGKRNLLQQKNLGAHCCARPCSEWFFITVLRKYWAKLTTSRAGIRSQATQCVFNQYCMEFTSSSRCFGWGLSLLTLGIYKVEICNLATDPDSLYSSWRKKRSFIASYTQSI